MAVTAAGTKNVIKADPHQAADTNIDAHGEWEERRPLAVPGPIIVVGRDEAFCLRGASQGDDDVYVMVNAYWETLDFTMQDGAPAEWRRVVDTRRESPEDIREAGQEVRQTSARYTVGPRWVVVLMRSRRT